MSVVSSWISTYAFSLTEALPKRALSALLEPLIEKPELYQGEMAIFLYDEFTCLLLTVNFHSMK
jgi:hypothetical protein